jgi:hypothetical protein
MGHSMNDWLDSVREGNAFEGPYRRTRPVTITRWMRLRRWLVDLVLRWVP